MPKTVDYCYTLVSPWTYLGDRLFNQIAAKAGAKINHRPVNLGRVFAETGGLPLAKRSDERRALRMQELRRWRDYRGIKLNLEPKHFPVSDKLAAGIVLAAIATGKPVSDLAFGYFRAVWAEERDISDPDTAVGIATGAGFDGKALIEISRAPETETKWEADTDKAIGQGVMGAPFFIIGEEKFWGQDRLEFVERELAKTK